MRMATVNRHYYFVPDSKETTLWTFSLAKEASDVRASELTSRICFPALPNARQAWRDIRLRAEAHESVPTGYKSYVFKDLADELSGSLATKEPLTRVPLTERLTTSRSKDEQLGE